MTIIVTDNCRGCRFTECVMVCPVSCFHGDDDMLYIDADTCIECQACIAVCPVRAIHDSADFPSDPTPWIRLNAERSAGLPVIETRQPPLPGADARRLALGGRAGAPQLYGLSADVSMQRETPVNDGR
ncbi:MAG: 4Fe-4S dicluster domain-containing protein [Lautropia sp.]